MQIGRVLGTFLRMLVSLSGARRVVELVPSPATLPS